jgi:hypothetical protein
MDYAQWRQEQRRQRELSRRVGADIGDGGAFRVEGCDNIMYGRLVGFTKRWRYGEVALPPQEILGLDPRHFPAGTLLVIVPLGWAPPIQVWYTYEEVAFMLRRTVPTIRNLVYKHKLEHKTYWDARGVYRRRVTDLPPATVRRLAELTGRGHWVIAPTEERRPKSRPRPTVGEAARRIVLERLQAMEAPGDQSDPSATRAEPS